MAMNIAHLVLLSASVLVTALKLSGENFTPWQKMTSEHQSTLSVDGPRHTSDGIIGTKPRGLSINLDSIEDRLVEKQKVTASKLSKALHTEPEHVDATQEVYLLWREAAELKTPSMVIEKLAEISLFSKSASVASLARTALADLQQQRDMIATTGQEQAQNELQQKRWVQALQNLRFTLFSGTDAGQRAHALQFLVGISTEKSVELIEFANTDPDPTVRLAGIQSAWRLLADAQGSGDGRILSVIQQASADQNSLVASTASNALSSLKQLGSLY